MEIRRGDDVFCSLGIEAGRSIQSGDRPVVVVFTGVPLTIRVKRNLPTHVNVMATENSGLSEDSTVLCEQVTVLSCDYKSGNGRGRHFSKSTGEGRKSFPKLSPGYVSSFMDNSFCRFPS